MPPLGSLSRGAGYEKGRTSGDGGIMNRENLKLWTAHEDIDPRHTKAITGRDYGGTSPSPQYVIKCLTDLFGPVGIGFGWNVVAEGFERFGDTALHWCRIVFWHTDRANTFEAYGQTKAAYTTAAGKSRVDEDAPKKSLTDAIVKAASQIGIAANIFLGRWDDQKYVSAVLKEFTDAERAAVPPDNSVTDAQIMIASAESLDDLHGVWKSIAPAIQKNAAVIAAKDKRKSELTPQKEAA